MRARDWCYLQIEFPGLGKLITNKAGRIEFEYDERFLKHLDLGISSMDEELADFSVFSRPMPDSIIEAIRCACMASRCRVRTQSLQDAPPALDLVRAGSAPSRRAI